MIRFSRAERAAGPTIMLEQREVLSPPPRSASGRCTFTTTRWPSAMRARCTCPIVPAASGSRIDVGRTRPPTGRRARCSITATTSASDIGGTSDCSAASSVTYSGGDQVRARREDLAELAERRPELLEGLAQPPRRLGSRVAGATAGRRAGARRPARGRARSRGPAVGAARSRRPLARRSARRWRCSRPRPCTPARCVTRLATLPSRNCLRPRIPELPTTTTSALPRRARRGSPPRCPHRTRPRRGRGSCGRLEDGAKEIQGFRNLDKFDPEWRLYARSAADDKAPIVGLLAALMP